MPPKPLVIVESPAKARTIAGFLGGDFVVESSVGHIRDLPQSAADIPAAYKGEPWARLGVDTENDFKPLYVVSRGKKDVVKTLKAKLKDASEVYLATDEDREGESIAWHLMEVLSPQVPVKRMVFHEITPAAIERAVREWRDLDRRLVDAQEARRILDRLYGYEVSPVLWKKVMPKLSAGRVQSVATRILVERERARMRFRAADWWDIEGTFARDATAFGAALVSVDGQRVVTGKDFDENGALTNDEVVRLDEAAATALADRARDASFTVRSVEERPEKQRPAAPFITSTLQQEASRKLRFGSQRTMQVAQRLYENGYITYMRTDSTTLSATALNAARSQARHLYGEDYVPDEPRRYEKKVKNAQEAHEAIRPAGDTFRLPDAVASELPPDEQRLYELIWKRTIASQMADAQLRRAHVRLGASSTSGESVEFAARGKVIVFPGFLRAYVEGADDPDAELEDREVQLPPLAVGDDLDVVDLTPKGHSTKPPDRFTEASLVKRLEELGVGRPSTYASIIGTIQDRGYVFKKGSALVPTWTAFAVVGLLEQHFSTLVDYGFTAGMEDELDEIAAGAQELVPWLSRFYFGNGTAGLKSQVSDRLGEIDAREINSISIGPGPDGNDIVVRVGRYGPYIQRGDDRVSLPDAMAPDELTPARAAELLEAPSGDRELGQDPATGLPVIVKAGRYGPYAQLGGANGDAKSDKPRTASLFRTMDPASVTLEQALKLLELPRTVGTDPDGVEIVAANGRYGPYIKRDKDTRSLQSEDELFTVTLDEALALLAEPKARRGQGRAAAPLRELGADPETGQPIVVKDGRYGPYATDGTTNASLPKTLSVEAVTLERAAELLADRRAKGPSKPKAPKAKARKGKS
ncbi:MAG: type I DNA topoisomerase [Actinobacteria bacterium]|nr:type I DNA topoisomerase [Actinomycetota bacterium]